MKARRTFGSTAAAVTAVLISTCLPSVANADTYSVADVLERAETVAVGSSTPADAQLPAVHAGDDGPTVAVEGADLSVTLGASDDAAISESEQFATVEDESITYAISHPREGATRFSAVLRTPTNDHPHWTFGSDTQLLLLDNGSVSISEGDEFIGGIEAPWAVDALGRSLSTHYEISGSTLTQVIDTAEAAFPVVADPTVDFFGLYIQVHLNRQESFTAVGGYGACAGVLSKSPVPFARLLSVACTTVAAIGTSQVAGGKCISIHYVVGLGGPAGVWWPWTRDC
ncbi:MULTISPECIES: hypothetical protein [unclassified Rathayibacter]|uniref:hypothetical protein n=1 Tax=unclassified Rathayibacter TaxID=2609250 RepID=UPI000F4CCAD8|nr:MULTISPECIES: hypothetical protein [unclassified Rathayibacter]MCJ1704313.1 hypothetical protein [Rathayibacter sp. VKM Ac-2926]ROP44107.1 hypothetical protein EDF45_3958 [Rathayibacter sp. PhB186]ROS46698.1 hypothetical protein EDF44_4009 [Rathayibacter sp. PhB185]TCL82980.1 hypothetical protein EDF49_10433 [Rathayibacter sp. PhB192]TCM28477.1 hypothetical protein EDF43_10433 [Rathayibacter sp. PhB179]